MPAMRAFRFVAVGYALLVFLIAPAWLAADEEPTAAVPIPPAEQPTAAVQGAAQTAPDLPVEAPVTVAGEEAAEPEAEPAPEPEVEPAAEPAKTEKKEKAAPDKEPVAKVSASASVTITDFKFTPGTVTVNEGDTVTWTNDGPSVHTATAEDGSFDTGTLRKGESGSTTFTQAGTIAYICSPHPFMKAKVVVQAAGAGGDGDSGSGGGSGDGSDGGTGGAVAGDDETSVDSGSALAATGGETLLITLLGLATFAVGLLLRPRRET